MKTGGKEIERLADKSWNSIPRFSTLGVIRIKGILAIARECKAVLGNCQWKIALDKLGMGNNYLRSKCPN